MFLALSETSMARKTGTRGAECTWRCSVLQVTHLIQGFARCTDRVWGRKPSPGFRGCSVPDLSGTPKGAACRPNKGDCVSRAAETVRRQAAQRNPLAEVACPSLNKLQVDFRHFQWTRRLYLSTKRPRPTKPDEVYHSARRRPLLR